MDKEWISASDVEKFGYCPLSWWLSESEEDTDDKNLQEGQERHSEITEEIGELKDKEEISQKLENLVLWLAVAATVLSITGLTFLRPEGFLSPIIRVNALIWLLAATFFLYMSEKGVIEDDDFKVERMILIFAMVATGLGIISITLPIFNDTLARLAQIISLSWLIGASYWLKRTITLSQEAKDKRKRLDMDEGEVDYVDVTKEKSKMFSSEKYHLRGRPDYIIKKDGDRIPVEIKTGRVPKGPFFSHIIQSAAYCLLIEEETGKAPPYGLIKYGDNEFEIDYDESLKELLVNKMEDMREIYKIKDAHRNHDRKGKCKNCSRREICPESLV